MHIVLKAICFLIAFTCLVIDAWREWEANNHGHIFLSIGLAAFVLPFAVDALVAAN